MLRIANVHVNKTNCTGSKFASTSSRCALGCPIPMSLQHQGATRAETTLVIALVVEEEVSDDGKVRTTRDEDDERSATSRKRSVIDNSMMMGRLS